MTFARQDRLPQVALDFSQEPVLTGELIFQVLAEVDQIPFAVNGEDLLVTRL